MGGACTLRLSVNTAVQACYNLIANYEEQPQQYDNFPQVRDTLRELPQT